ncbi:MAG: RHS repeat-associated core domain-containing protein [Bryobacteraceae bacterium]|nr:RHS repeat-associated core domain-containing protein [Bryobacteraceae bacterium]
MPIENGARTEQWCYNNRMQPVGIRLGTSTAANCDAQTGDLLRLTYGYGTTNNNGNVLSQAIARPSFSASQSYTYDGLNRLRSMTESAAAQTYVYDRYGNRAVLSSSYIPIAAQSPVVSSDTEAAVTSIFPSNRWSGGTHDNAGNQTARYGGTFAYDAENRVTSSTVGTVTTTYAYDGEGRRVKKDAVVMVYDAFGKLAVEYGGTPAGTGRQYLTADHLGSTRLVTNSTGGDAKCSDYLPFGEEIPQGINSRGTCYAAFTDPRQKFTGKERDAETGLDYFGARYLSGAQGRFTTPDRLNVTEDRLISPSNTLNKYGYAANNPLRFIDPDGRDVVALVQPPHGFMPGHFALFAHNPNSGAAAFMSFGPTDTSAGGRALTILGAPMGGTAAYGMPKSADELRQSYAALSIQTTPEQAQEVIDFINRFSTTENPYRLFENNCSTVCRDALKAVGVLPRDFGSITPFGLWASLYRRHSSQAMQRFATTTRYGEVFQTQNLLIDSRKGTDYGSPRFGMNVFDFMMLMLRQQQPKACVEVHDSATGQRGKQCE